MHTTPCHCDLTFGCVRQIDKLVDLPGIRDVAELPMAAGLLAGFLPQLVLRLFYSLLPTILALLERCGGLPAESEVEWGVVRKYFSFQVRAPLHILLSST